MTTLATPVKSNGNRRTLVVLALVVCAMVGLAYASVPLYKLFCQVTGYGGTTQVADERASTVIADHPVKVRFDANVNPSLNWQFAPVEPFVEVKPGEELVVNYRATNMGPTPSTGTSTFNVTPVKAGPHFMKLDCFCFVEQTLKPGQSVDMPVRFFVDPDIVTDENARDIREITLSYTFFPALGANSAAGRGQ